MSNQISENYLSAIAAYVLRWYVVAQDDYPRARRAMITYALANSTDLLDQLYDIVRYARAHPNMFTYRAETSQLKTNSKSIALRRVLADAGVDVSRFMPYRIAYVGEESRATAELLATELHARRVGPIEDAPLNSVGLVVATSTMHQKKGRNIKHMRPKLTAGGYFLIRENDVHTNRKNIETPNYAVTEFLDVMSVVMDVIGAADSVEVPRDCCEFTEDACIIRTRPSLDAPIVARVPLSYIVTPDAAGETRDYTSGSDSSDDDTSAQRDAFDTCEAESAQEDEGTEQRVIIQHDYEHSRIIASRVEGCVRTSWPEWKARIKRSKRYTANVYRNAKSWDKAFKKNGFDATQRSITYTSSNPHRLFYKLYRAV